jgi:hypothetical protein
MGILGAGTAAGLALGLVQSTPTVPAGTTTVARVPAAPDSPGSPNATTSPTPAPALQLAPQASLLPACRLLSTTEVKGLLKQVVNDPVVTNTPYCHYSGIVVIAPAEQPPSLSVTEVVAPRSVASTEALLRGGVKALCAEVPKGTSCATVEKTTHLVTIGGKPAIWSQTTTNSAHGTELGTAISAAKGRVVLLVVDDLADPGRVALAAMQDLLPRL